MKAKRGNRKIKILLAEDEPIIRQLVSSILGEDYIILNAGNGQEAVEIAGRHHPDLILMDIMMPKLDGYTACSIIKTGEVTRGIPVVMLTGLHQELNRKLAEEMGADGYITKPFTSQDLQDAITLLTKCPR